MAPPKAAPRGNRSSKIDGTLSVAETAAKFVAEGLSGCGLKGVEGPAKTVLGIISHIKKVRDNSSAREDVVDQICSLTEVLRAATVGAQTAPATVPATDEAAVQPNPSIKISERISKLQSRLDAVNSSAEKLSKQTRAARVFWAARNSDILKSMAEKIKQAQDEFMFGGQIAVEIRLRDMAAQLKATVEIQEAESTTNAERWRNEELRQEEESAANAKRRKNKELKSALDQLPYEAEATYKASVQARHAGLLEGTRRDILAIIDAWLSCRADEQQKQPFFVLRGGAGTGKSTIAFEVAQRADRAGLLGGSFFFVRGSARLSTAEAVFPTLAWQLINNLPALHATALAHVLGHLKHGARQNVDQQAKDLFRGLLSGLPEDHPPILIVIDAVDECTESAQDLVCRMLSLMMGALSDLPCPIRVFVTSRPEIYLEEAFESPRFSAHKYVLHDIPRDIVDTDIRLYFMTRIEQLPDALRRRFLEVYPDAYDDLTDLAAGLFIYATTAFEFLKQCHGAIARGMDQLVATRKTSVAPLQRLDDLYGIVLHTSFPVRTASVLHCTQEVLGCLAVLQEHISPQDLAHLIGRSLRSDILPVVQRLGAVVSFKAGRVDAPMQLLHASFAEYLVDHKRSGKSGFHVDEAKQHASLAKHCLSLLLRSDSLVRNICRLPNPAIAKDNITDLTARIQNHLPAPMPYSCRHWPAHVACSGGHQTILPILERFCTVSRVLEWLEALALLDSLDVAIHLLPVLCRIYPPSRDMASVGDILYDAFRIALDFSPAIKACPEQLYLSALPLIPAESRLKSLYVDVLRDPRTLTGPVVFLERWISWHDTTPSGPHGSTISGIRCAQFAPHGRWLAVSGGSDCAVHLCQPVTGNVIQSITGHPDPVKHISFSSNGLRMVSTSKSRILIHSTRSGLVQRGLTVEGSAKCAFFVLEGSTVLYRFCRTNGGRCIALWHPDTDSITYLDKSLSHVYGGMPFTQAAASPFRFDFGSTPFVPPKRGHKGLDVGCVITDVSSDGHWAVLATEPCNSYDRNIVGAVLDLSLGSVVAQFAQDSKASCLVPGTETQVVVPRGNAFVVFDIPTGNVLRTIPFDGQYRQVSSVAVSRDVKNLVALTVGSTQNPISIHVQSSEGAAITLSAVDLTQVALSPDGGYITGVLSSGNAWRTLNLAGDFLSGIDTRQRDDGSTPFSVAISDDLSTTAVVGHDNLTCYHMLSGERRTVCSIRSEIFTDRLDFCVRLSLSGDGSLAGMVRKHDVAIIDMIAGQREIIFITGTDLHDFNAKTVSHVLCNEWAFESGDFSPDGSVFLALVRLRLSTRRDKAGVWHARQLAYWDLAAPREKYGLIDLNGRCVGSVVCSRVSAEGTLHFSVTPDDSESGRCSKLQYYQVLLPRRWDDCPRSLWLSETAGSPGNNYRLSTDGWIRSVSSEARELYWVPQSRRSGGDRFEGAVATRGHRIAMVSEAGLLTVVDIPAYLTDGVSAGRTSGEWSESESEPMPPPLPLLRGLVSGMQGRYRNIFEREITPSA